MKKILRKLYKNSFIVRIILLRIKRVVAFFYHHTIPEKIFLKWEFKKHFGYKLNIRNPETLNEKIQWLKLYDRTPLHTICADKYAVREFVKEVLGYEYLVPLVLQTLNPKDITPENLPDYPVIIKTNHDSYGSIIVTDKSNEDWRSIQKKIITKLKRNYYYKNKEWPYKNIRPCIIVEKLLIDERGEIPYDYKLHCFHHKVEMMQVDIDRGTSNHCRNWYNSKWERLPFKWSSTKDGKFLYPRSADVEKPDSLEKMITLSERLSENFLYVRVDWYIIDGKLFFGELTFSPAGGSYPFDPKGWDKYFGHKLMLPLEKKP